MFRHHDSRPPVWVVAILAALASLALASPAAASDVAASPVPSQEDEAFDANETEGTIERVRYQLLGIAAVTGALLVGYIWHTDPERRQRVATRRRDDRERAAMAALDDTFVLPVEADDEPADGRGVGEPSADVEASTNPDATVSPESDAGSNEP